MSGATHFNRINAKFSRSRLFTSTVPSTRYRPIPSDREQFFFYFNYHHHTAADTLDKHHLAENAAVIAVTAYALADASTPAPRAK